MGCVGLSKEATPLTESMKNTLLKAPAKKAKSGVPVYAGLKYQTAYQNAWLVVAEEGVGKIRSYEFPTEAAAVSFFNKRRVARVLLNPTLEEEMSSNGLNPWALRSIRLELANQCHHNEELPMQSAAEASLSPGASTTRAAAASSPTTINPVSARGRSSSAGMSASTTQSQALGPGHASNRRYEGWLSKRSSHEMVGGVAAHWQRRYWTLEDCMLSYQKNRGGPVLKAFDLRRARSIKMQEGQGQEIELDFGFRVWRLRAENAAAARRWYHLLHAARLVPGEPLGDAEDLSE